MQAICSETLTPPPPPPPPPFLYLGQGAGARTSYDRSILWVSLVASRGKENWYPHKRERAELRCSCPEAAVYGHGNWASAYPMF